MSDTEKVSEVTEFLATDATLQRIANALEQQTPGYEKYSKQYFNSLFLPQRDGKVYGVKVWKFATNPTSVCEKTRDNIGLVCQPSTDTVEGKDDYIKIPMFKWYECNYKRYDDGFAYPVAMLGDGDYHENGDADCGALQMTFYWRVIETDTYYEYLVSDTPNRMLNLEPWPAAVRADGTVMPYFIYSRYHSVVASDGLYRSQPGKPPVVSQSHNGMITQYQKKGNGYWGAGSDRMSFAQIMLMIKYATKNSQTVFAGCTNYASCVKASIERSTKATYFPIAKSDKSQFEIGSNVIVGYPYDNGTTLSTDRGYASMQSYAAPSKILRIEDIDDNNCAVYLDCSTPFDTMPITGGSATKYIYMATWHWDSGATDSVIGHHDGSPVSNTNARYPYRIQGLEYHVGGYDVASDTVMFFNSDYSKDVYYAPRGVSHTSDDSKIKNTYTKVGTIPNVGSGSDFWIGDIAIKNGVWYPSTKGSGSSQGVGDMIYAGGTNTSGSREYLQAGGLWNGSYAGLCFLDCWFGLGHTGWNFLSLD